MGQTGPLYRSYDDTGSWRRFLYEPSYKISVLLLTTAPCNPFLRHKGIKSTKLFIPRVPTTTRTTRWQLLMSWVNTYSVSGFLVFLQGLLISYSYGAWDQTQQVRRRDGVCTLFADKIMIRDANETWAQGLRSRLLKLSAVNVVIYCSWFMWMAGGYFEIKTHQINQKLLISDFTYIYLM